VIKESFHMQNWLEWVEKEHSVKDTHATVAQWCKQVINKFIGYLI